MYKKGSLRNRARIQKQQNKIVTYFSNPPNLSANRPMNDIAPIDYAEIVLTNFIFVFLASTLHQGKRRLT